MSENTLYSKYGYAPHQPDPAERRRERVYLAVVTQLPLKLAWALTIHKVPFSVHCVCVLLRVCASLYTFSS